MLLDDGFCSAEMIAPYPYSEAPATRVPAFALTPQYQQVSPLPLAKTFTPTLFQLVLPGSLWVVLSGLPAGPGEYDQGAVRAGCPGHPAPPPSASSQTSIAYSLLAVTGAPIPG